MAECIIVALCCIIVVLSYFCVKFSKRQEIDNQIIAEIENKKIAASEELANLVDDISDKKKELYSKNLDVKDIESKIKKILKKLLNKAE